MRFEGRYSHTSQESRVVGAQAAVAKKEEGTVVEARVVAMAGLVAARAAAATAVAHHRDRHR